MTATTPRRHRPDRPRRGRLSALVLLGSLLAASACSGANTGQSSGTTVPGGSGSGGAVASPNLELTAALQPFGACDQLLGYVKQAAIERVGPYGLPGSVGDLDRGGPQVLEDSGGERPTAVPGSPVPQNSTPGAPATTTPSSGDGSSTEGSKRPADEPAAYEPQAGTDPNAPTHSETNVQEKGVDEPDIVKTDGKRLLAISGNRLVVVDVSGVAPQHLGSIALPGSGDPQLLWSGNHVLVLDGNASVPAERTSERAIAPQPMGTLLSLIDIANPAEMKILNTVRVDGQFVSARMVDGQARVVTSSSPARLPFVNPSSSTAAAEQAAENANRRIVEESKVEDWLPSIHIGNGNDPITKPLLDCGKVSRPKTFSGFGMLSVLSVDVNANEVNPADAVGVMADGQTVYASKTNLYVTTPAYVDPPVRRATTGTAPTPRPPDPIPLKNATAVHKFDIAARGPATYRASGAVDGSVLNQYSISEDEGSLRIATTSAAGGGRTGAGTESFVRVLQEIDGELKEVGTVGNMGRGEQIKSVRFIGKQGYVVTFRQTDPLYTLNLAEPTAPKVVGELKVLGYSAYLHPAGENLLIGVGQDATETGRAKGTQVALYDVSDLANPRELQKYVLLNSTSEVEQAFHAFLWWEPTKLAMVPVDRAYVGLIDGNCPGGPNAGVCAPQYLPPFTGAIGLTIDRSGIKELGRVVNPGQPYDECAITDGVACGPCPADATCSASPAGTGAESGTPMETIDCSKQPCTTPTTAGVPSTTVPCPADARCQPPEPIPPCVSRGPGASTYCPGPTGSRIERSLVVGDTVFTFSDAGLKSSDLTTLREEFWLPFR